MTGPEPQSPPPSQPQPAKSKRSGIAFGQIIGAVLLVLVIIFILENTRSVKMRLIIPEVHASLSVALLIAALLGGLGVLLLQYRRHRKSNR